MKCFRDLFEIGHTEFFHSCIFPWPYVVISEIGISSDSNKIHALPIIIFFLAYPFHGNIDRYHIDQIKGRLVKR